MAKNVECTVTITETPDGKLAIMANIPERAEHTIAGALARTLIERSAQVMNEILGDNQTVEKMTGH